MKISIERDPTPADVQIIHAGLDHYNRQHTKPHGWQSLTIFIRDEQHEIVGGLLGETFWDWCHIDLLWLGDAIRQQGFGRQLLQAAEAEALARGCIGVYVDTLSFQAPEFYLKYGYEIWGKLTDFPPGHERIFYQKHLRPVHQETR